VSISVPQPSPLAAYERELDKWRYVSSGMLAVVCGFYGLEILDPDTTKFTFRKP
jgi:hypothetical protein